MGSSSITRIVTEGITGSTGPAGPIGPRGPTGTGTGKTGITGPQGHYITSINFDDNGNPILETSDGRQFSIYGLTGNTGYGQSIVGLTLSSGLNIFKEMQGATINIYGLSFGDGLNASIVNGSIVITPEDRSVQVIIAENTQPSKVAYAKQSDQISSTRISSVNNEFTFSETSGITHTSTFLDSDFFIANIPSIEQDNIPSLIDNYQSLSPYIADIDEQNGIILDLSKSSVFVINTPIGIAGFTFKGNPNFAKDPANLITVTLYVLGNEFWSFPSNIRFENRANSTYFGCGMNILNLTSSTNGENWFATIADRGYGVDSCNDLDFIGSCCYRDDEGNFECDDYRTKASCDRLNGQFRVATTCEKACGTTLSTFCCSEGRCLSDIGEDECELFGGSYYATDAKIAVGSSQFPLGCTTAPSSGTNMQRLCYDKCQAPVSCCKNGICLGQTTKLICESVLKGKAVPGTCSEIDCCSELPFFGACCSTGGCEEKFIYECRAPDKTFMGHGTRCTDNACCQEDPPYEGICCLPNGGCIASPRFVCDDLGGSFQEGQSTCQVCNDCWRDGVWICGCVPCPRYPPPGTNCCPRPPRPPCTRPPCPPPPPPPPPPCPNPPCNDGVDCVQVGFRRFCLPDRTVATPCPTDCGPVLPPGCPNPPCGGDPRPPVISGPFGPGGGGGDTDPDTDPDPDPELTGCGNCINCHCPKFPINGWMYDQLFPETTLDVNGNFIVKCWCLKGNRDRNVEQIIGSNSQCYDGQNDPDLEWMDLVTGQQTGAPSRLPACCFGISPCMPKACWCSSVFDDLLGQPYPWSFKGCCDQAPCNTNCTDPNNCPVCGTCKSCIPILRIRSTGAVGCSYIYKCKPKIRQADQSSEQSRENGICCFGSSPSGCLCPALGSNCDVVDIPAICPSRPGCYDCQVRKFEWPSAPPPNPLTFLKDPNTGIFNLYSCDDEIYSPCYDPTYLTGTE
jgi:hypothetical protein